MKEEIFKIYKEMGLLQVKSKNRKKKNLKELTTQQQAPKHPANF